MSSLEPPPVGDDASRILILGGTAEARALAADLVGSGRPVVSSLAGRVRDPALPLGEVRVGGFSTPTADGVTGLARYLEERSIAAVVDATHPFAAAISGHAAAACVTTGTPLVRLQRPGWGNHPDSARWTWVDSVAAAVTTGDWARRPFVTTGRQSLAAYLSGQSPSRPERAAEPPRDALDAREILLTTWADKDVTVRLVEPPTVELPAHWHLIRSRGPYRYANELDLMRRARTDLLVTKDSGGSLTAAKLEAARDLGVAVLVVARPPSPVGVTVVSSVAAALAWLG